MFLEKSQLYSSFSGFLFEDGGSLYSSAGSFVCAGNPRIRISSRKVECQYRACGNVDAI